jgi:hypothetical protein
VMVTIALWPLEPGRVEARGMIHVRANPHHGIPGDQGGQPLNHWANLQTDIEAALAKKGQTLTQPDEWREIKRKRKAAASLLLVFFGIVLGFFLGNVVPGSASEVSGVGPLQGWEVRFVYDNEDLLGCRNPMVFPEKKQVYCVEPSTSEARTARLLR